jgi:hypothetical protein
MVLYENRVNRRLRAVGNPLISCARGMSEQTHLSGVYKLAQPNPELARWQLQRRGRRLWHVEGIQKMAALGRIS